MAKYTKYIISYITIFSVLFSSLGVTIYYHHCNTERITLKSIFGKPHCEHDNPNDIDLAEVENTCCNHHEMDDSNKCNVPTPINESSIKIPSCCVDSQLTFKLNENLLKNSISNSNDIKPSVSQSHTQIEKNNTKDDFFTRAKQYLDKKIKQPIKKFISLLRQLSNLASQSDSDSYSI